MNGHLEIVKHLLENTEDSSVIEAVDIDGSSALALAVANGHKDLARYR
jgi:ankyrin repeat protein